MDKKTPLYEEHVLAQGKIVPFAGYMLPVQYQGVIDEHMAVREKCGIFDVSHMGEILCEGKDALANLNYLLTNEFSNMEIGQARYSPMCNEMGGVVDDLIVYKVTSLRYLIVVNAANIEKDFRWMQHHAFGEVVFSDISDSVAQIALQGPKALEILKKLVEEEDIPSKYYTFTDNVMLEGIECIISKTGYTGENGYEIYTSSQNATKIWRLLLENGKKYGLLPCGLGARDTLRLEAGMPLYGHEMNEEISPLEAGLSHFVKLEKKDFIGKGELIKEDTKKYMSVGLKVIGRGIIREHMQVYQEEEKIGITTSGTYCPFLGYGAAIALIEKSCLKEGDIVEVEVRKKRVRATIVKLPFYKRKK